MYRLAALVLLAALLPASTTLAQSRLSLIDVARLYCAARISGDMAPVLDLLTPELAGLVDGVADMPWQGTAGTMTSCMPVGASGNYDHPESVLAYSLAGAGAASDRLVMSFVDEQLRIDNIAYGPGGSLRETLAAR